MNDFEPSEAELNDFIDGRLSHDRRQEVERWLADHPERARELERQRELNAALRDLGAEILDEPVPDRLREVLMRAADSPQRATAAERSANGGGHAGSRRWTAQSPMGAVALVLLGLAIGWLVRSALEVRTSPFDILLADASYAFSFYSQDKDHAIQFTPDQITAFKEASSTLFERKVDPPDLAEAGLEFRGARIAPLGRQTGTFFFFEDDSGKTLGVVFWPQDEGLSAGFKNLGQVAAQFWFSEGLGFAVMGEGDEQSLGEIGDKVLSFYADQTDGG